MNNIEIRGCKDINELKDVLKVCDNAFDNTPYEYFERHLFKDKTLSMENTRILIDNNKILSTIQVFPRKMYLRNKIYNFGGIGNVATLPEYQNRGYASMLMKNTINYMRESQFPFSLLTTTINHYYEKFGYKIIVRQKFNFTLDRPYNTNNIRIFIPQKDLQIVRKIYSDFNENLIGPFYRNEVYWNSQLDFCGEDRNMFLVKEVNGKVVAYIRAIQKEQIIQIMEFAANDNYNQLFFELVSALALKSGIKNFTIYLSNDLLNIIKLSNYTFQTDTDLMILFLDKDFEEQYKALLLQDNIITFWLSDFF